MIHNTVSKAGGTVRGGGGICPAKGHAKFLTVNLAEAQDLARVAEGKQRKLVKIPDLSRLEATGLRVQGLTDERQVRASIGIVEVGHPKPTHSPAELDKRTKAEWNGLHVRIPDQHQLWVRVQSRKSKEESAAWEEVLQMTMDPLTAFTVEGQDIVWHPTKVEQPDGSILTVWTELSLMRVTTDILEKVKKQGLIVKQRKKIQTKFEPKRRTSEEIQKDEEILQALLKEKDTMTLQDKVYMKDIWNKCLGWIDMTGEFIVDGLFLRCPDLLDILGKTTAELAFAMMISLIDKGVRALDLRTEVIARETYHEMPLSPPQDKPFQTLEEGFEQFAQLGMRPRHWLEARAIFVCAMEKACPYLEEPDLEVLQTGTDSCAYRFWSQRIMLPALEAIKAQDELYESEENRAILQKTLAPLQKDKKAAGMRFYKSLLSQKPELMPYFGTTDMNFLAGHLFDAIELLVEAFNDFGSALYALNHLGKIHDRAKIPVWSYPAITELLQHTLQQGQHYGDGTPQGEKAVEIWQTLMDRAILVTSRVSFVSEVLLRKALQWSEQVAYELQWDDAYLAKRKLDIESEIRTTGTYAHTEEEVVHGARVAWRNSAKCVGRIAWNTMLVRDRRHVTDLDHIFAECVEHQRLATADGSLKAVMTVFKPRQPGTRLDMRFWNLQLIRFACYEMPDGSTMGDKANLQYTKECIEFGWSPPEPRTEFDVLPVVIEDTVSGTTKMFEVPEEYHKVTMIEHPKYPEFGKLGLRWCVVPTVSCFTLTLGGLQYTCCPFNGWFMECEITRDLLEPGRMDKMETIAHAIGVDPTDEDDFWRERVALETNKAVVYSFRRDGNSIVDHVTAQAQFLAHDQREKREGRECPAQWSWVVPSSGGATMPIWHHEMRDFYVEPQYLYQAEVTALRAFSSLPETALLSSQSSNSASAFEKILILYASVTGTAEGYAYKAKKMLRPLHVDVKGCEKVDAKSLYKEFKANGGSYSALLFITSTFGEGDPPTNAVEFFNVLKTLPVSALSGIQYSIMAIGSRVYPDYCQAGIDLDYWFRQTGAESFLALAKADELEDQAGVVGQWIGSVAAFFNVEQKKALVLSGDLPSSEGAEVEGPSVAVHALSDSDAKVKEAKEQQMRLANASQATDDATGALARFLPDGSILCKVTRNSELVDFSKPGSKEAYKSTRFLEFDLTGITRDGSTAKLSYATGDHAKIIPCNASEVVSVMCSCLKVDPNTWVEVKVESGMGRQLTASISKVGDILSMEIDLAIQDKDGNLPLLQKLLTFGRDMETLDAENLDQPTMEFLRGELQRLEAVVERLSEGRAGDQNGKKDSAAQLKKKAIAQFMENYIDVPSLLKAYPIMASKLSLADCIEVLPRHKPRYYSIASSAELHPSSLQLTVGVLEIPYKATKMVRQGLCSNYLACTTAASESNLQLSNFVRLDVNTSSFRMPSDMSCPMIMVGPGTGISPMLGFLQARQKAQSEGVTLGPCTVFFGCRTEDDFLHREQMRAWEASGIISNLQVAFSRVPGQPKEYVQHRIGKIRTKVWDLLKDPRCHYYVCGDSNMAEDVYDELFLTAKLQGQLSHKDSWSLFQKMKQQHRFQTDTWGVLSGREGLAKQAEKKYNQAENWLKGVQDETGSSPPSMSLPVKVRPSMATNGAIVFEV